jgi:hypothetical protein
MEPNTIVESSASLEETPRPLDERIEELEGRIEGLNDELGAIEFPPGTCRVRMVNCGDCPKCEKAKLENPPGKKSEGFHGPYLYFYNRQKGKLQEGYVGREDRNPDAKEEIKRAQALAAQIRALNRDLEVLTEGRAPRVPKAKPKAKAKPKKAEKKRAKPKAKAKRAKPKAKKRKARAKGRGT